MRTSILLGGDLLSLLLVTLIGFATHGETNLAFLPRLAAVFLPLAAAWLVLAPWFGLTVAAAAARPDTLWRVPLVMLFAAPLAAVLRGAILSTPVIPVFVLVLGLTSAVGLSVWRLGWGLWMRRA